MIDKNETKIKTSVKKNGVEKEIEIDLEANEGLGIILKKMLSKGKCTDIFKDTVIEKNG